MPPRRLLVGLCVSLGLVLGLGLASSPASGQGEAPPIGPIDLTSDPPFENVTAETEEVSFLVELARIEQSYTGQFTVDLTIGDEQIAHVEEIWPPDQDRMTIDTRTDNDEGPGVWEPSIGAHAFNLTIEADGHELPVAFELPVGPDPAIAPLAGSEDGDGPVRFEPDPPVEGQPLTVTANVSNHGSWPVPADAGLELALTDGEQTLARTSVDEAIEVREDITVTFEDAWTPPAGTHQVSLELLAPGFEEITTANNQHTVNLTVRETGLTVDDIQADPAPAQANETITVNATVTNAGDEQAPDSLTVLYLDDEPVAEADTAALDPGASTNVSWTIEAAPGEHELRAIPDGEDKPTPPPKDAATASLDLLVGPDLVALGTETTPDPAVEGDNLTTTATVQNRGAPVDQPTPVRLHVAGEPVGNATLEPLAGGQSTQVSFEHPAEPGEHRVNLTIDPDEAIAEADESNNRGFTSVYVREYVPDLLLEDLRLATENPYPGQSVPAEAILVNGDEQPVTNLSARFLVDGRQIGETIDVADLEPGVSERLTSWDWEATVGNHTLSVHVGTPTDLRRGEPLAETSQQITVEDLQPNLVLDDLRVDPSPPEPGQPARLLVDVTNEGQAPAQSVRVAFTLDGERLGLEHVDELAPGANTTLESPTFEANRSQTQAQALVNPDAETHTEDERATLSVEAAADTPAPGLGLVTALLSLAAVARRRT